MHFLSSDNDAADPAGVPSLSSQHKHRKSRRKSRVPSSPEEEDDDELEYERNHGDPGISSALEMLPIPCAISGPTGLPTILLVNPPSTAAVCRTPENDGGAAPDVDADNCGSSAGVRDEDSSRVYEVADRSTQRHSHQFLHAIPADRTWPEGPQCHETRKEGDENARYSSRLVLL